MSNIFSTTRDEVLKYAYQEMGVLGEGDTPSTVQITEGTWFLQSLIKLWATDGMPLWDMRTGYILPTTGVSSVLLGANSANSVSAYVPTTVSISSSGTTLNVTSGTGIANSNGIGIDLGTGVVFWTTVSNISGTVITLGTALPSTVAAGNVVYAYATANRITRPLRVISAYQYNTLDNTRFRIRVITKDEYYSLGGPTGVGVPTQVYYDPQLGDGNFYVYPRFLGGNYIVQITYHKEFDNVDTGTDTFDFPQEYYLSLMKAVASTMGGKYGMDKDRRGALMAEAHEMKQMALDNGTEEGSFRIVPNSDAAH